MRMTRGVTLLSDLSNRFLRETEVENQSGASFLSAAKLQAVDTQIYTFAVRGCPCNLVPFSEISADH